MPRAATDDERMPPGPSNGRFLPLLLLVTLIAGLLGGCSLSTSLCDEGDTLVAAAQPARALEVYARAKAHGDGCAEQGLGTASTHQRRAVEEAARGEAAERAGDIPAATAAYQAALPLDVTNALAIAGLARFGQPKPVPPPSVATQPSEPSWWAGPWSYFLGSLLIAALSVGAVLWFVERRIASGLRNRLDGLEKKAATSNRRLDDLESDRSRFHDLHKQLNASDRDLRLQTGRIDHLIELFDLSVLTQAEPTSEVVVRLEPLSIAGEPAPEGDSDAEKATATGGRASNDAAISAGAMRIAVNLWAIRSGQGRAVQQQLAIQRVIERAIKPHDPGKADPSTPYHPKTPRPQQEPGPFAKAAADSTVDPVWERFEESWWITSDYRGLADCAKWVTGIGNSWHDLVLGKPAERIALGAGFSPPSAHMMETIATKVSLPGDNLIKGVRRFFQYTGIVLGTVTGAAPLANACISSLAHDLVAEATAKAFHEAIGHALAPGRSVERPIPGAELGPGGERAQQFYRDLVAAASQQRAHERNIGHPAQQMGAPQTPVAFAPPSVAPRTPIAPRTPVAPQRFGVPGPQTGPRPPRPHGPSLGR